MPIFSISCVNVDAASTAERRGVAPKYSGLKSLYFKATWASRLATPRSKTLPRHDSNAIRRHDRGSERRGFPGFGNAQNLAFLKTPG